MWAGETIGEYTVMGQVIVERKDDDDIEVLEQYSFSDKLVYTESDEDLMLSVYNEEDVPRDPGLYVLMYVATLTWFKDYFGEVDVSVEPMWHKVSIVSDRDAAAYFSIPRHDATEMYLEETFGGTI